MRQSGRAAKFGEALWAAIQSVKDRVIRNRGCLGYTIPPETKARVLRDIEHELSTLAVEDLPEWELVEVADGIRDKHYRPVMQAQDEARRMEAQRRQDKKRRADEAWQQQLKQSQEDTERARRQQEEELREAEKRAEEEDERRQEEAERAADKRELVRYGTDFARQELQDVEDLDPMDRLSMLRRIERALDAELTGDESEKHIHAAKDRIAHEAALT